MLLKRKSRRGLCFLCFYVPHTNREGTQQSRFVSLRGEAVNTGNVHVRWIRRSALGTCICGGLGSQRSVRASGLPLKVNARYVHLGSSWKCACGGVA